MQHRPTTITTALAAVLLAAGLGAAPPEASAPAETPPGATAEAPRPLDLNTATVEQLQAVRGIGPATAARIVEFREEHGPFRRVEDLVKVRGIGETTFAKIRPHVRVARDDD